LAGHRVIAAGLLALAAQCAWPQDLISVQSPNGKLEFRLFVAEPEPGALFHLAYQVRLDGKPVLDTSYLGVLVHDQEPVLCESVALVSAERSQQPGYHSLFAKYLQNGTVGRRINVEVRVWDDGAAFRYVIPPSAILDDLPVEDELTEFSFIKKVEQKGPLPLPFQMEQPGTGWVGIYEAGNGAYPKTNLVRTDENTLITRLVQKDKFPRIAYEGHTPFTGPWRIVILAAARDGLEKTAIARALLRE
jgi:Glycosyl-hydrolase 97 N-terminal